VRVPCPARNAIFRRPSPSIDVLSSYVRDADAFTDHAGAGLL
jgi:hypothetical protein